MDVARFMSYVQKQEDGCWLWIGGLTGKGYGKCWHEKRVLGAHVVSYKLFCAEVPVGQIVRHSCNIKRCVNPVHLKIGTYHDNLMDALEANGKIGRTPIILEETVMEIFRLRKDGLSQQDICHETGVAKSTVGNILIGTFRRDLKEKFEKEHGEIEKFNISHKFTLEDARLMRKLYNEQGKSCPQIAKEFNTNYKYVWKIVNNMAHAEPLLKTTLQIRGDI